MLWSATEWAASAEGAGGAVGAGTGGAIGAVEFAPLVGGSCPPSRLIISGVEVLLQTDSNSPSMAQDNFQISFQKNSQIRQS